MRNIVMRRILAPFVGLAIATGVLAAPAYAGEDKGLCNENHERGEIPGEFPLKACFDGNTMHINNTTQFPLVISFNGDTVGGVKLDARASGAVSRLVAYMNPGFDKKSDTRQGVVPPGYMVRAPFGDKSATVKVATAGKSIQQTYVIGEIIWKYMPTDVSFSVMKAVAELIRELADVGLQYVECMDRNGGWGDLGCRALMGRNVTFAYGRVVVNGLAGGVVKALLALFDSAKWADAASGDLIKLKDGKREFSIGAKPKPAPPKEDPKPEGNSGGGSSGGGNSGDGGGSSSGNDSPPPPPAPKYATVQNKYLAGNCCLEEDPKPAYLSTSMQPYCKSRGCAIGGTDMGTGESVKAICWDSGSMMTNENRGTGADDANPHKIDSDRWLYGERNGSKGYISYVYLTPGSRDLVGHC